MPLLSSKFNAVFSTNDLLDLFNFKTQENFSFSVSTDSRTITKDQIFIPLYGEKFDGHEFIDRVLGKGIRFSFCERKRRDKVKDKSKEKIILVDSTIDTYNTFANSYRKKLKAKVIAITGSSGKTTVKELIASVLSSKYKVHKTEANFNNEVGLPKTILETPTDTEVLVLELAMRAKGEIKYLSKTCEPDVAVITNVGTAHIGRLGDLPAIIEAKCEIFDHLKEGGAGFLHKEKQMIEYLNKKGVGKVKDFMVFDLSLADNFSFRDGKSYFNLGGKEYFINAQGETHILNSVLAIKLAEHKLFGLTKEEIQKGLSNFTVPTGRGNIIKLGEDRFIIDESYNANPDSVKASVTNLVNSWDKSFKKILVLGELAELGHYEDKLLSELGTWLEKTSGLNVVTIGNKLKQIKASYNAMAQDSYAILDKILSPKSVVLIKGSRVAGLEEVVKYLTNKYKG